MNYLNIILPVYNEEKRLERGVETTVDYLTRLGWDDCQLTIVDNASVDATQEIARQLCEKHSNVSYIRLDEKGVGVAFRQGVAANEAPIVGYMDIDLSTDLKHLQQARDAFESDSQIGMVNGSRWAQSSETEGRKWYRSITSNGLTWLLQTSLNMRATDAICGFKFFRRDFVEELIARAGAEENGWFYIIELLLRAERSNMEVLELPVHWEDDSSNSKVEVVSLIRNYIQQINRLRRRFRQEERSRVTKDYGHA